MLSQDTQFFGTKMPSRKSEIDWSVTDDLAVRAHRLLETAVGHTLPVQMKLQKANTRWRWFRWR